MNQPDNVGRPAVSFTFNNAGGILFRELTRKNTPSGEEGSTQVKRHLAIILDGLVMSAPTINSEIREHGQISGSFTNREVDQLVNILRAGALPATLKPQPVSESTMGSTLGQDTINKGLFAIGVAFAVVLAFMIVYYRFAGLVASVALLANLVLTVGFMVAVKATFTLPGLAGLVLMLGMAVDANILIYERLREEREKGASILLALRNGYDRAFGTIIDTHLSSIFTAVVLYIEGNDQLKGFGVSLTVGLLISLFTSLFVTRVIFDLWAAKGWLTKLSMLRFFSRPDIDFMSIRYYLFAATGILTILGGALFIGRLPDDLNIDFVGGTAYSGQLRRPDRPRTLPSFVPCWARRTKRPALWPRSRKRKALTRSIRSNTRTPRASGASLTKCAWLTNRRAIPSSNARPTSRKVPATCPTGQWSKSSWPRTVKAIPTRAVSSPSEPQRRSPRSFRRVLDRLLQEKQKDGRLQRTVEKSRHEVRRGRAEKRP